MPPLPPVEPAEPSWWERASGVLLENWTGILGAVILVTGVGFLGIYAALRVSAFWRFWMISGGAGLLLAARWGLRRQAFALKLNDWLLSSAAAIFLFACVGASSLPGLQWTSGAGSYLLLFAGIAANLALAWRAGREAVASLHAVLSLVALAVLPPSLLTLGAAASVVVFSIFITYRQQWRWQLVLSIASFFAFHLYWHSARSVLPTFDNAVALGLVLLVGVAGGLVQYRRVYAARGFEPVLFTAHLLNWTCLGLNLYLHSTGSVWKTVPLLLGALGTFWTGRRARQLGLEWLFRTDTIISLMLGLGAAFSLLAWQATPAVVLLFMLLETLLVAHVMAREAEPLVYRVALAGALLAGTGLLLVAGGQAPTADLPHQLRLALFLALGGAAGIGFVKITVPWLRSEENPTAVVADLLLLPAFGGLSVGLLLATSGVLALAHRQQAGGTLAAVLLAGLGAAGLSFGLARVLGRSFPVGWLRTALLAAGQAGLALTILGLHQAGLGYPACWLLLLLESLAFNLLLKRYQEALVPAQALTALLAGLGLLLAAGAHASGADVAHLVRLALLLAAGGTAAIGFVKYSSRLPASESPADAYFEELLSAFGTLGVGLLLATSGAFALALMGRPEPPVTGLLAASAGAAGLAFGLARLLGPAFPLAWLRMALLATGQVGLGLTIVGLHKAGLSYSGCWVLLYVESFAFNALLAWCGERLARGQAATALMVGLLMLGIALGDAGLSPNGKALLLLGAAVASVLRQLITPRLSQAQPATADDFDVWFPRVLGWLTGAQLLTAGSLVYSHPAWAGWAALAVGAGFLLMRRRFALPGLAAGLLAAAVGFAGLQWMYLLNLHTAPSAASAGALGLSAARLGGYLMPVAALAVVGALTAFSVPRQQFVCWPWLYLLGAQLAVAVGLGNASWAVMVLEGMALGVAFFAAAGLVRRHLTARVAAGAGAPTFASEHGSPTANPLAVALRYHGLPDRHLLHLAYLLLTAALGLHLLAVLPQQELFGAVPARWVTAAALLVALAGLALVQPPAEPRPASWRKLHPWLLETALVLGLITLVHEGHRTALPLVLIGVAILLESFGTRLPARVARLWAYGRALYGAAALAVLVLSLQRLSPAALLSADWWLLAGAAALLFGYAGLALRAGPGPETSTPVKPAIFWPAALAGLEAVLLPPWSVLVPWLLYPAFVALTAFLVQSFDKSLLTVLLMLEVVGVFVASLALRRADFRYVALAGMAVCLVRLVFFDLRQSQTLTRAIVFIFMGLLLLGMNALYARFRQRAGK